MLYKIIKCNKCNEINITTCKERLKCNKCHKSSIIINNEVLYKSENANNVRQFYIKYNYEKRMIKNGNRKKR